VHRNYYAEPASVAIAAIIAAAFVQIIPGDGTVSTGVRVVAALPLLFVLPGRAVSLALDLPHGGDYRPNDNRLESCLWAAAISIALAIGGAFLLNVFPAGLTRVSWTALLTVCTVLAASIALVRRAITYRQPLTASKLHERIPPDTPDFGRSPTRPYLGGARGLVILISALGVAILGIGVAWSSARAETYPGFTQLWLIKQPGSGSADEVTIVPCELGVQNFEEQPQQYHIRMTDSPGGLPQDWFFQLQQDEKWVAPVTVEPGHKVDATLYHGDDPRPYRHVTMQVE
jgi:uncharacterized protein DUF1616